MIEGTSRAVCAGLPGLRPVVVAVLVFVSAGVVPARSSARAAGRQKWVTSWTASAHGVYPVGTPSAQPELRFAFPEPSLGALDQTFRMIVRPAVWGPRIRVRFTNAFGTRPLLLDNVYVALQRTAGHVVPTSSTPVTFERRRQVVIPAGETLWSDAIAPAFLRQASLERLDGRKLAVSFHVPGPTGPMTWHSKALQTSYVTAPRAGLHANDESDGAFLYTTTSWFYVDAIDVMAPADTAVVVCLGDSITDGTGSTLNGDDRWPDVLAQRARARFGPGVVVVNAGVGGNRVAGPSDYREVPARGGPGALDRLERDVLSLSGVAIVIWLEGINDLSAGADAQSISAGFQSGIERLRAKGIRVVGATLTSALHATDGSHGTADVEVRRQALNAFIRRPGVFDDVVDFDAATTDPDTGELRAEMRPSSTIGGDGDGLHPNRAGYAAMAGSVDLALLAPRPHR